MTILAGGTCRHPHHHTTALTGLQLSVAVYCTLLGVEAFVVPFRLATALPPAASPLTPLLPIFGLFCLIGGSVLIAADALQFPRAARLTADIGCALLMLCLATVRTLEGAGLDAAGYVVLGIGMVVAASPAPLRVDSLLRRIERGRPRRAWLAVCVVVAVLMIGYGLWSPLPRHDWTSVGLYVIFGLALLLAPVAPRWMHGFEATSLRSRLVLGFVAVASLPAVLVTVAVGTAAQNAALADASTDQQLAALDTSRAFTQFDTDYRQLVQTIATRGGLDTLPPEQQLQVLKGLVATDVYAFSTYDSSGRPLARTDDLPGVPLAESVMQAASSGGAVDATAHVPGTDRPEFIFVAPLPYNTAPTGYVAAEIESSRVVEALHTLGPLQRPETLVFVVDASGRALLHPDTAIMDAAADLSGLEPVARALAGSDSGSVIYQSAGNTYVGGYARVPSLGWVAVVSFPTATVFSGPRSGREMAFGILLLAMGMSAVVGLILAHRLVLPLRTLGTAAEALAAADDASQPLPSKSYAEIDRLTAIFGAMRGQLLTRSAERASALEEANTAIHVRDEFVSVAAHELKTPVTVLRGYAQLLLSRAENAEPVDVARLGQILRRIDSQSRKLARLTEELLDVTRLERGTFKLAAVHCDLNKMLRDIADGSPHQSRLRLKLSDQPQLVYADPLRTEQVLLNLIDNAAKFSPEDAPIDVSIESSVPGMVRVRVRDYGLGIPPEHREGIFERFHQAHAESHQSGLGLGLYIAKQIVDLHGGTLRVDFPVGGGACFTVGLPTAVLDPEHAANGSMLREAGHLR